MQLDIPLPGPLAEVAKVDEASTTVKASEHAPSESNALKVQISQPQTEIQSQSHSAPIVVPHPTQAEQRSINSVAKPFKVG